MYQKVYFIFYEIKTLEIINLNESNDNNKKEIIEILGKKKKIKKDFKNTGIKD
jgi:hypothetical protein